MYDEGEGIPEDDIFAYMWWNIASSLGDKDARDNKGIVAEEMPPTQIEKAQELSKQCLNSNYKDCD